MIRVDRIKLLFLFFLIIGLITIPFIVDESFAQRFSNYEIIDNGDGTFTNILGKPDFIQDSRGQWVDHIVTESQNSIFVESLQSPFFFNKSSCELFMYEKGRVSQGISPILNNISWKIEEADFREDARTGSWTDLPLNSFSCVTTTNTDQNGTLTIEAIKQNIDGSIKIELIKEIEKPLKRNITYRHFDPAKLTSKFGFSEQFTLSNIDTVEINGQPIDARNISSKISVDRAQMIFQDVLFVSGNDTMKFDLSQGFDDFSFIDMEKVGQNVKVTVKYRNDSNIILQDRDTVNDPTFGFTGGTNYRVITNTGSGSACPSPSSTTTNDRTLLPNNSETGAGCQIVAAEWDTTSITDGSTVTDTQIRFTPGALQNGRTCEYNPMQFQPSTLGATDLWNDIINGTSFVSGDTNCQTASQFTLDLGSSADTDVENQLTSDWWGVGITFDDISRDSVRHRMDAGTVELEVTYSSGGTHTVNISDGSIGGDTISTLGTFSRTLSDGSIGGDTVGAALMAVHEETIIDGSIGGDTITTNHVVGAINHTQNIIDGSIGGDTLESFIDCSTICTVDISDGSIGGDTLSTDHTLAVFNAIKLYLNTPDASRLGGVFAFTCPAGEFVTGITTNGTITCAVP